MKIIQVLPDTRLEIDDLNRTVAIVYNTIPCDPTQAIRLIYKSGEIARLWQALAVAASKVGSNGTTNNK